MPLTVLATMFVLLGGAGTSAGDEAKPEAGAGSKTPSYVQMEPLAVPVLTDGGRTVMVSIEVTIEVDSEKTATSARAIRPRLNDASLTRLFGSAEKGKLLTNGAVDIFRLKDELTAAYTEILGEGTVNAVLVQNVTQRRL